MEQSGKVENREDSAVSGEEPSLRNNHKNTGNLKPQKTRILPAATYHRITLAALLLFTVFRVGINLYFLGTECLNNQKQFTEGGESAIYSSLARSMAERQEYNLGPGKNAFTRITPGYPALIALNMRLFGRYWIISLFTFQVLCAVTSVFFIYSICRKLRGHSTGMLAGFLLASYAPLHYISLIIYREAVVLPILAVFLYLLRPKAYNSGRTYWQMGLLIGLASIIREEQLLLLIPATLLILHQELLNGKRQWKPALLRICAMTLIVPALFLPWIIRNMMTLGRLQMMSSNGGIHLYLGNSEEFTTDKPLDYGIYSRIPEVKTMPEYEVNKIYMRKALNYIITHPGKTLSNAVCKLKTLFHPSIRHLDDFPYILLSLFAGALVAAVAGIKKEYQLHAMLAGAILAGFLIEKGLSGVLFFPTVEFAVIPFFGLAGAFWMLYRREQPLFILTYLVLMSVNIIFVPQHRHRWMIDQLTIIWTAVLLHDILLFIYRKYLKKNET